MLALPTPRGPLTEALLETLHGDPGMMSRLPIPEPADPLADDDFQLALTVCYELHYRGFPGVDERWEWEPDLIALRVALERRFEAALRERVPIPDVRGPIDEALRAIAAADDAPSLSKHLMQAGTLEQYLEFAVHRSIYQLKEADPHSWAIPRLHGRPKAALIEIQADEYGGGRPERIHAALFAKTLRGLGLDDRYGAYVDHVPGITLATVNLMSMFGLQRRLRGCIVGHLALFEMTSSIPNRRYADGLRRLGVDDANTLEFYDEHVEADAVHESVAAVDLAGGLAAAEPEVRDEILFGALALGHVEGRWASHILDSWAAGASSLRLPLEPAGAIAA